MSSEVKDQREELLEDEEIIEEEVGGEEPGEQGPATFYDKNRKLIFGGAAILAVVIGGFFWWSSQNRTKNLEGQEAMIRAVDWFEKDSINLAINGDGGQFQGFLSITEDYSGTPAANLAKMYLGICYLKSGDLDLGIEYLEDFSKESDFLSASSFAALGYAYEEKGEYEKAGGYYEQAANTPGPNEGTTPAYLMAAGRAYETFYNQNREENESFGKRALDAYYRIRNEFPNTEDGRQIDKYIGRLSPGLSRIE